MDNCQDFRKISCIFWINLLFRVQFKKTTEAKFLLYIFTSYMPAIHTFLNFFLILPAHTVKKKWKSLRDCFRTEYKKQIKAKASGNGNFVLPSTWLWYKDLLFLRGQIGTKRKVHNMPHAIQEVEDDLIETKFDIHYEDLKLEVVDSASPAPVTICSPDQQCETMTNEVDSVSEIVTQEAGDRTSPALSTRSGNLNLSTIKQITKKISKPEIPIHLLNPQHFHFNALREDDCYYFLMSLHKPLNSLPIERAMFVRFKIQELIYNEISRINQS